MSSYCFQRSVLSLSKKSMNNLFNNPFWNFLEKEGQISSLYFLRTIFFLSLESRTTLFCLSFVGRKGQSFNTLFKYSLETEDRERYVGGCEEWFLEGTGHCQITYEMLSFPVILLCLLNRVVNKWYVIDELIIKNIFINKRAFRYSSVYPHTWLTWVYGL